MPNYLILNFITFQLFNKKRKRVEPRHSQDDASAGAATALLEPCKYWGLTPTSAPAPKRPFSICCYFEIQVLAPADFTLFNCERSRDRPLHGFCAARSKKKGSNTSVTGITDFMLGPSGAQKNQFFFSAILCEIFIGGIIYLEQSQFWLRVPVLRGSWTWNF